MFLAQCVENFVATKHMMTLTSKSWTSSHHGVHDCYWLIAGENEEPLLVVFELEEAISYEEFNEVRC